jgi:hypothetical protein
MLSGARWSLFTKILISLLEVLTNAGLAAEGLPDHEAEGG